MNATSVTRPIYRLLLLAGTLLLCWRADGQGIVYINNRINNNRLILAGIDPSDGSSSSIGSPDFVVEVYGGPLGAPTGNLVPLVPFTIAMRGPAGSAPAGYITPTTVTVPDVPTFADAEVLLRLSYARGNSADLGPFPVRLGGWFTGVEPPDLSFGSGLILVPASILNVPEPSELILFAMGLAGLLIREVAACRIEKPRANMTNRHKHGHGSNLRLE